jgi:hypothetical protein
MLWRKGGICGKSITALHESEVMKYNNHETITMASFKTVEVKQEPQRSSLLSSSIKTFLQVYWHTWPAFLRLGNIEHFHFCVLTPIHTHQINTAAK